MGGVVSRALEHRSLTFDDFLDLLLPKPRFDVVLHIHHLKVDLIEDGFRPVLLVQNGGDTSPHHIVGAHLLTGRLLCILPRMHGLFAPPL